MNLYQLAVPKDDAQSVMNELGDVGLAHFIDLNAEESPYNLPYTPQIKACENTERLLAYLQSECKKHMIKINPPKNIDGFLHQLKIISDSKKKALNLLFEEIQKEIAKQE
jgi:vacuolar-type H+-ATPase subunit I/STV1